MMAACTELEEIFAGLGPDDLGVVPPGQPWMSEIFESLDDTQFLQDDLLTDAVSEFMKCKAEKFELNTRIKTEDNSDQLFVGDEVEINDLMDACDDSPLRPTSSRADGSAESSGYASCVASSGSPSPSNKLSPTDRPSPKIIFNNSSSEDKYSTMKPRSIVNNADNRSNDFSTDFIQKNATRPNRSLFKTTFVGACGGAMGNRVHVIVRQNPTVLLSNGRTNSLTSSVYSLDRGKIKRPDSIPHLRQTQHYGDRKDLTSVPTFSHLEAVDLDNKRDPLCIVTSSPSVSSRRPYQMTGSQSSSDSDTAGSEDAKCRARRVTGFYPQTQQLHGRSHYGYTTCQDESPFSVQDTYDADLRYRGSSPSGASRPSLSHDDGSTSTFLHSSTVLSRHSTLFQTQMHSRVRSPNQLEKSEVSQTSVLLLTDEEKRTLLAEGYSIPTRLPLSKQEERNLKKIRRKIKNKISAQESRRKKKEYLETLERKVDFYSQENSDLKRRIDGLESTNRSLLSQLRLLQQLMNKSKSNTMSIGSSSGPTGSLSSGLTKSVGSVSSNGITGGSGSTCLMVFLLCFAALLVGQPPGGGLTPVGWDRAFGPGPTPNSLFGNLAIGSPRSLVPGSLNQLGYTWSKGQKLNANGLYGRTSESHSADYPSNQSAQINIPRGSVHDRHWIERLHRTTRSRTLPMASSRHPGHDEVPKTEIRRDQSDLRSRSRLLGSPKELEECAPVDTFWSFLFGQSGPSKLSSDGHCGTDEERDNHLVTKELEMLRFKHTISTGSPNLSESFNSTQLSAKSTQPVDNLIQLVICETHQNFSSGQTIVASSVNRTGSILSLAT